MYTRRMLGSIAMLVAATGCASKPKSPTPAEAPANGSTPTLQATPTATATKKDPDLIVEAELADPSVATGNAFDAVRRLRPQFLTTRGTRSLSGGAGSIRVSVDGSALQSLAALKDMNAREVKEIRYLSAPQAAQTFGTASGAGPVILVKRK